MRISIGNKRLEDKPVSQREKGRYFKDLSFKTGEFRNSDFKQIIGQGLTITYLFKDKEFDRSNNYMSVNYVGTQFICVDVDGCDVPPTDFVENIRYKPSIVHTTFSNLTERKNYKYCYHLLYFFDDIIYGEDNFNMVFHMLTDDYYSFVDKDCKDCHRVIFTSNSSFSDYVYRDYDLTYKVDDFIKKKYDDISDFFSSSTEKEYCKKTVSQDKSTISSINLSSETKILQEDNKFSLNDGFWNDLYSLKRSGFIEKYSMTYPYFRETCVDQDKYVNGYADLRDMDYYDVPTSRWRWDVKNNRPYIPKVEKGNRNKMLWVDAVCLMKIKPDITREHLIYLLIAEVYKNFDNEDEQMSNWFIVNKAKEVWDKIDNLNARPLKKSFKIDKHYWLEKGYTNQDWLLVSKIIMKEMRCQDFGDMYDLSLTVEQNVAMFCEYDIKTTKRTLVKWCEENDIPYETDKQRRDRMVMAVFNEEPCRSSREIAALCEQMGIKVSHATVVKIIEKYGD